MCTRFISPLMIVVSLFCSCSVKSDRSACPGLLFMSVSGGDDAGVNISVSSQEKNEESVHVIKENGIARAGFDLERGEKYRVKCYNGVDQNWNGEIEFGGQMPSLFACSCGVDCGSDVEELSVKLFKQFCRIHIEVHGVDCRVRLRGNVCGVDLNDLTPLPGHFCVIATPTLTQPGEKSQFVINVPRQIDNTLSMELLSMYSDKRLFSQNIGEVLALGGLDWEKESLDDASLKVDCVDNTFCVSVQNWEKVEL